MFMTDCVVFVMSRCHD